MDRVFDSDLREVPPQTDREKDLMKETLRYFGVTWLYCRQTKTFLSVSYSYIHYKFVRLMFFYVNQFRIKYVAFWHMYYILHIWRDVIYIALPSHLELRTLTTFFHSPFSQDCETKNIFFDCSTSTSRENPECAMDVTTCVRPTHAIYSVLLNRYITPIEMLSVQGIWRCDSENLSAWNSMVANGRLAQSLAGNGFSATVAQAAFLTSLVECDAWRDVIHREDPSEPQGSLVTREQSVKQSVEQSWNNHQLHSRTI